MDKQVRSQGELPIKKLETETRSQATDADSGASEGHLGQRLSPDAVSGASAI